MAWKVDMRRSRIPRIRLVGMMTVILAAGMFWPVGGCAPPTQNVLVDANGNPIRLRSILAIVRDPTLTSDQKRQALRDLGITDEDYIELVLREL